ncbi:MAG: glycosyltransferase [Sphingobium sp.]
MKVLHVITALNYGGAEAMLAKLVGQHGAHSSHPDSAVLSLLPLGRVGQEMAASGVAVETLGLNNIGCLPGAMARLTRIVRRYEPDLIQGWMYHGNIAAAWAVKAARRNGPMLWNIRHSLHDIRAEKVTSRLVIRLGAMLSRRPRATIYNAAASVRQHVANGYAPEGAIVIPNGFDPHCFRPDEPEGNARTRLRERFGIEPGPIIVAVIARRHPMKDHATAIEAVGRARRMGHDVHLLLAGAGTDALPADLQGACNHWLPHDRLSLLGDRADVAEWLPGCDIVTLSSAWGESFPNILGEAMACGVPCVATDVGDSRAIIGESGVCVPPGDPAAIANAIALLSAMGEDGRRRKGELGRQRVVKEFSLTAVAARYAELYERVLREPPSLRGHTGMPRCAG